MKFNENTQFPVFTENKEENCFNYYPNREFVYSFKEHGAIVAFSLKEDWNFQYNETPSTKEVFLNASKDLLQKTGLINLFEGSEKDTDEITTDMVRDDYVRRYDEELKEEIENLQNTIHDIESENSDLEGKVGIANKRIESLQRVLHDNQEENKANRNSQDKALSGCRMENELLKGKIQMFADGLQELRDVIASKDLEIQDLKSLLKRYL